MKKSNIILLSLTFLGSAFFVLDVSAKSIVNKTTLTSKKMLIDRMYQSMKGPYHKQKVSIVNSEQPELLWFTGAKIDVVDGYTEAIQSPEYLCHGQILFRRNNAEPDKRDELVKEAMRDNIRLFTLGQGLNEMHFPENFGVPVSSKENLISIAMLLNPNPLEDPVTLKVKSTIEYINNSDVQEKMTPLYLLMVSVMVPFDSDQHHDHKGSIMKSAGKASNLTKDDGSKLTSHWYIPPGRHIYRYDLKDEMKKGLPKDTTVHYINVHLHPFAEFLELRDATTKKTIFKSYAQDFPDKIAVKTMDYYSSKKGILLHTDHKYEIITAYNNTTDHEIDAMAAMYLYLKDPHFSLPAQ